ncbi:MAG TPA: hypothetical protein VFK05_24125 [Polyangiaceae bacterium]|nr:hypothetical protein [Polyangiaceae bacterium]
MTTICGAAFGVEWRRSRSSSATPKALTIRIVARDHQYQQPHSGGCQRWFLAFTASA